MLGRIVAALAALAPGAALASELRSAEGDLLRVDFDLDDPVTGEILGTFLVTSDGDVRTNPLQAMLRVLAGADPAGAGEIAGWTPRVNEVRRVDPATGRPLRGSAPPGASCSTGAEAECLPTSDCAPPPSDPLPACHCVPTASGPLAPCDVASSVDLYTTIALWTQGFSEFDPGAGGFTIWNSTNSFLTGAPIPGSCEAVLGDFELSISETLANFLVGNPGAVQVVSAGLLGGTPIPFVMLNQDDCDGFRSDCATAGPSGSAIIAFAGPTLNLLLTPQQQATLGCGEFYGTNCECQGVHFLNIEASALVQCLHPSLDWDYADPSVPQPCTVDYESLPLCARETEGGISILPGCRGPGDPGYDEDRDGSSTGLLHPLVPTQQLRSELAALSFNALVLLAALSTPDETDGDPRPTIREFDERPPAIAASNGEDDDGDGEIDEADEGDPNHIGASRSDGCSFRKPGLCVNVQSLARSLSVELGDDPSGPPRVRWVWETGADFETVSATEGLGCFEGWSLHSTGPETSFREGIDLAVRFVLGPPPDSAFCVAESSLVQPMPGPDRVLGTDDDRYLAAVYGAPEPSAALMHGAALGALVLLARRAGSRRARGSRAPR